MTLSRFVEAAASLVVAASLALLAGCSGKTAGADLNTPQDPTDPTDPTHPADAAPTCTELAAACDPGDDSVGSEANCGSADYCYSRTAGCSTTVVWCAHRKAQCAAVPTCDKGDAQFASCPPGPVGTTCYTRTMCGSTIACLHQNDCNAIPVCDPGDKQAVDPTTCSKPNVSCYSRTTCGVSITCYTP